MTEYTYETKEERSQYIAEAEVQGLTMLHDDFAADYDPEVGGPGTLTFDEPTPPTEEELAREAEIATCEEYLSHSPDAITQPQIWFILRCFAKKLGFTFE